MDAADAERRPPGGGSPHGGVPLRSFLGESAIYGLGSVADKLIGFLLLPLTTALLAPADFGILNVFGTTATLAYLLVSFGLHQAVPIVHARAESADERRRVFGTAAAIGLLVSAAFLVASAALGPWLGAAAFGADAWKLVYVLGPFTVLELLRKLAQTRLRLLERPRMFVAINLVSTVLIRAAALGMVALGFGVYGWAVGELVGIAAAVVLLWPTALGGVRLAVDRRLAAAMVPLGASLLPSLLAHWVMMGADRYVMLLALPDPRGQIGLYSVGERISTVMQLVNFAFVLGWQRFAFENLARPDGPRRFAHGLTLYAALAGYVALALALLGDDLTRFITPASYGAGVSVIPMLTLAGFLGGFGELVAARLQQANLGVRLGAATWVAAGAQVGLLFWAIPRFGIEGAAAASFAGQALKLALIGALVHRTAPVPFELRRLARLALVLAAAYAVGGAIGPEASLTRLTWQLGIVAATPLLVLATGFLRDEERGRLLGALGFLTERRTERREPLSDGRDRE